MRTSLVAPALLAAAIILIGTAPAQQGTTSKKATPATAKAATTTPVPKAEATPPAGSVPSTEVVEAFMKRMFGYNENLAIHVASVKPSDAQGLSEATVVLSVPQGQQVLHFFITADGQHAIMGDLMPFGADPYESIRDALKKGAFGPTKGHGDSPMQIVEFADLECPACKGAMPTVEKLQQDFPQVKFVFQSFPLVQLHPWAMTASKYLDCIYRSSNEGAWSFIQSVYSHQGEINETNLKEKLDGYVGFANMDAAKISACAALPETEQHVQLSMALGNQVNVAATPTLFVNGRPVSGLNPQEYESIKSLVQYELTLSSQGK